MKNCEYYKEQIMLDYYNEDFDREVMAHIADCLNCRVFKNELNTVLSIPAADSDMFKKVKNNIVKPRRNIVFGKFRNLVKFSAAAVFLFVVFSTAQKYNFTGSKKTQNNRIQPVEITTYTNGGDEIIIEEFSELETELDKLESELKSFNEVI